MVKSLRNKKTLLVISIPHSYWRRESGNIAEATGDTALLCCSKRRKWCLIAWQQTIVFPLLIHPSLPFRGQCKDFVLKGLSHSQIWFGVQYCDNIVFTMWSLISLDKVIILKAQTKRNKLCLCNILGFNWVQNKKEGIVDYFSPFKTSFFYLSIYLRVKILCGYNYVSNYDICVLV